MSKPKQRRGRVFVDCLAEGMAIASLPLCAA